MAEDAEEKSWWKDPMLYLHMALLYCAIGLVCIYFAVQSLTFCVNSLRDCCCRRDKHTAKSIRIGLYRLVFSMVKSIMLIFFVYFYHFPDRLIKMIPSLQVVSKVLLFIFGLGWFFDLFFTVMLDERRLKISRDGTMLGSVDKKARKDTVFNAVGRIFFWRKPSHGAQVEVERMMCDRTLQLVPLSNAKCSRVSLDQYLFVFTLFHLIVATYKLFTTLRDEDFLSFFDVYCMFPLGVFAGEKVITVFTGFTPWWTEYLQTREKKGVPLALVGLLINMVDFGLLIYSIFDDCLGKIKGLDTFAVLCMMVVDAGFDFVMIGKSYLEDTEPNERYVKLPNEPGPVRTAVVQAQFLPPQQFQPPPPKHVRPHRR